ncbi:CHAT domain-containing protein [Arthrobacter sp. I2-34]|uniref:CHAT domain-containing protein n=1 Tax=Arthrobacter hankyongi TaxID=2904801 RepID=A0ABS9LCD9_9MICC|nr:CHAT domain-containing protein [Arthrobacter hankyongi]MCG2624340.1 CHAT domain-containing protein [Arthrobacter hankyongi]
MSEKVVVDGDIELEIGSGSQRGEYTVRVIRARAGGEPSARFRLDVDELLNRRSDLERTILASAVSARRTVPRSEEPVRQAGEQLFMALFTGAIGGAYRASLGAAQQAGDELRLVLRLAAPELAALPWEMLYDPETGSYLCRTEPLVRRIPAADYNPRPLKVAPPLRILGVVSSPRGLQTLDVEAEKAHLEEALAGPVAAGLVELVWTPEATWDGIHEQLLAGPWHVLHFIGHGDYDLGSDEGLIALVDAHGRYALVEASRIAYLLSAARPIPRLVVLNSCSTGQAGTEDLFSGTAAALVRGGISAVAAMQFTVSDGAAIAFARGFYTAIAHGRRVDEAVRNGRISITGNSGSTLEWVTPVVYVRGTAASLFALTVPRRAAGTRRQKPDASPKPGPVQSDREQDQLRTLYLQARNAHQQNQFETAIGLLDKLLAADPGYRDGALLRDTAIRRHEHSATYQDARKAEDDGDWAAAARGYALLEADPHFADAADRRRTCESRQQMAALQAALRQHAEAMEWQAVLDLAAELKALEPDAADPDGLATRARLELRYKQAAGADNATDPAIQPETEILTTSTSLQGAKTRSDTAQSSRSQTPARNTAQQAGTRLLTVRHASAVNSVTFSPDGTCVATASWDETARIWDAATGGELLRVRHDNVVNAVAFSPEGSRMATASSDETARIWDAGSGIQLLELQHGSSINGLAFSPDGNQLATASEETRIWDSHSGALLLRVRQDDPARGVAFNADGSFLASAGDDIRLLNMHSGALLLRIGRHVMATGVAFSPDGTSIAAGSDDRMAWIWNATTGKKLTKIRHESSVRAVAFSPGGTRLATGGGDRTARLWDIATGAQLLQVHHDGWVSAVSFRPDGGWLATASRDGTARIWHITGV